MFEVNTDLQKNVQAKITAHLAWPSLVNSSQRITFPLTNTNSSSVSPNYLPWWTHTHMHEWVGAGVSTPGPGRPLYCMFYLFPCSKTPDLMFQLPQPRLSRSGYSSGFCVQFDAGCLCLFAGWGGDSTEPRRRPCLRPSSPIGTATKPLCVFRKAGWPVRNLFIVLLIPSSNHKTHSLCFYSSGCRWGICPIST